MALLFFEGFETVGTETGLAYQGTTRPRIDMRWYSTYASPTPATQSFFLIDDRHSEGYAIQMGQAAGSTGNYLQWEVPSAYRSTGTAAAEFVVGMWVHVPSTSRTFSFLTAYSQSGGAPDDHILFRVVNSQDIDCRFGYGAYISLGSASSVFTAGSWHHVEVKFKIGNSPYGYIQAKVDGATVFTSASIDTQDFWGDVRWFRLLNTTNSTGNDYVAYDDIYILVTSGSTPTDYLGPNARVYSMPPDGDSTPLQWTPSSGTVHYALIDENGADSADYVETSTNGYEEMFTLGSPADTGTVHGVKIEAEAIDTSAGANNMDVRITSGSTTQETNWNVTSTTAYDVFVHYEGDTDPDTSSAWTTSGINALKAGVQFNT